MVLQAEAANLLDQYLVSRSPELREQVVIQSVPLVHYLLGRLGISKEMGSDYEDLVNQGLLGLIDAVDRYDPKHGAKFSTYAGLRVRGKILDYLRSTDWMSRSARQRVRHIQKAVTSLWATNQREPTEDEIGDFLGMKVEDVQLGLGDSNRVLVSLDSMTDIDQDGEDTSLHERLSDENQANPSEVLEDVDLKEEMVFAIKQLTEREQLLLSLYYYEELTFKDIGKVMGITESRVCQLHARALLNLKAVMNHD
ncbi:MAG: FliA/WhiG family RNA polymerase sigma factor [Anaerolineaceae bacterium]|nr:FliA/WhiG family RNA polymerase sigma factor [Anaerolineaceae bacterium]